MKKSCLFIFSVFFLVWGYYSCSTSIQPYNTPERKDLGDNMFEYVNSPLYEESMAKAFNPELGSPEAAVAKFLSSKARKDSAWKEALVPEEEWTDRLKRKIEEWNTWKILKWQLKRIEIDEDKAYVTVYFEIEYEGGTDEGEDEFELILRNGIWRVFYPPT